MSNPGLAQKIVVFNAPRERLEEKIEPVAPDPSLDSSAIPVAANKPHSLKSHFKGAAREVIGYLDAMAKKNPDRFVWCRINSIVEHCCRYKGAGYSRTTIERCLRALRDSGLIKKHRRNGKIGYIVMRHEEACRVSPDGFCELVSRFRINWLQRKATYHTTPSKPSDNTLTPPETLSTFGINNLEDDSTTYDTKNDGRNDTKNDTANDTKNDVPNDVGTMYERCGYDVPNDVLTSKNLSVNYRKNTSYSDGAPSNLGTVEPLTRGAVGTDAPPLPPPSPNTTPASREANPASRGVRIGEQSGMTDKVASKSKSGRDTGSSRENIRRKFSTIALSKVGRLEPWPDVWEDVDVLVEAFGEPAVIAAFGEWVSLQDGSVDRPMQSFLEVAAWLIKSANPTNPTNPATIRNSFDRLLARLAEVSNHELTWTDAQKVSLYIALKRHAEDDVVSAFRLFYSNIEDDFELRFAAKNFIERLNQWVAKVAYLKAQKEEHAKLVARLEEQGRREREELLRKKAEEEALVEYELGELTK